MPSPHPIPLHLKALRGNPGHQTLEPSVEAPLLAELPPAPEKLGEVGRAEWKRVTGLLFRMGILSDVDRAALVSYCMAVQVQMEAFDAWNANNRMVIERVDTKGHTQEIVNPAFHALNEASKAVLRHAVEFGFTPSSRSRVGAVKAGGGSKFGRFSDRSEKRSSEGSN